MADVVTTKLWYFNATIGLMQRAARLVMMTMVMGLGEGVLGGRARGEERGETEIPYTG